MRKILRTAMSCLWLAQPTGSIYAGEQELQGSAAPSVPAISAEVLIDVAPARAWQAFLHELEAEGRVASRLDHERFEAVLDVPGAPGIHVGIDWDERTGGARITWQGGKPGGQEAVKSWLARVAARAPGEPRDNYLCRGPEAGNEPEADSSLEEAPTCRYGAGRFSSALFELEKCGDYESALRILAACAAEQHAGGLIRVAQFYEVGLGVPRRPERMTEYLRRAAESSTPGYRDTARVQYATALYFGVGVPADRKGALRLFREAAQAGEPDAIHFLRYGHHAAWRREDGGFYVDRNWRSALEDGG